MQKRIDIEISCIATVLADVYENSADIVDVEKVLEITDIISLRGEIEKKVYKGLTREGSIEIIHNIIDKIIECEELTDFEKMVFEHLEYIRKMKQKLKAADIEEYKFWVD